jgi:sarcosine oxidase subunit alpha
MTTDVLILGGGPAGLASAYEISCRGHQATIVDEGQALGGQLRSQTQVVDPMPAPFVGLRGFELADKLIGRLQTLPVEYLCPYEAIGVYADGSVGVSNGEKFERIIPQSIVVATGAAESAFPFPGWTLPGVMTIGAAQILINRERIYPGKRTVVIGSSDTALEIAQQMRDVGIQVLGVVEAAAQMCAKDGKRVAEFQETAIPLLLHTGIVSASGRGKVEEVLLQATDGREHKYQVDFVCLDGGRHPILEALAMFNCQFTYRRGLGGWLPCYTSDFESSVSGIFVAGQAAGLTGHAGVCLTGALAGIGAVDYLEKGTTQERQSSKHMYWNELERLEAASLPDIWQTRQEHIASSLGMGKKVGACNG